MALRLIIEDEEGATTIVPLGEEEVTIGREPGNTIQLTEQNVSRQHARLAQGPDGWVIEDLESYNGVKVNGVLVEGSVTLNEGDVVQIGDYHLALSNNVEQTTLNIDRPGQAAEPNRVMPSVDIPRISASEAAAIATPSFTSSGDARGHAQDRREDEREGGGRGLWIVLGLAAVLGVGFFAFRMTGPSEAPPKGNQKGTQAAANTDTKLPQKALTPDPAPPDPTPPDPTPPDPTPPDSTPPDPTPPDPTSPDPTGQVAPPDPSAGDVEPPIETPTKKVTPKPPVDKTPKPPKPVVPKGDPVALLEDARKASVANNSTQAYDLARKSYDIDRNSAALKLMGLSACKMGDAAKAKSAYKKLDATLQKQLQSVCQTNGVQLEP